MAADLNELYREDFYAWALEQADALRWLATTRPNERVDFPNLIEEVEGLAQKDSAALKSQLKRVIEHLLKLEHSPAAAPRFGWQNSLDDARAQARDVLTPTLAQQLPEQLANIYERARKAARLGLLEHGERDAANALPEACPYTLDQILDEDWYPPNRHGLPVE